MKTLHLSIITIICITMGIISSHAFGYAKESDPVINETRFQLKVSQTFSSEPDSIKVKFLNVTGDSRCPSDVTCVWQGEVTIFVNVIENNQDLGDFRLTSRAGKEDLATQVFNRHSIQVVKVEPYPTSGSKISLSDYVATLVISKSGILSPFNQTFPISDTGFAVTDEIIYPGNNATCKVEGVDSFPESTALKLRVLTQSAPWCKIRVCVPTGLLDSVKPEGTRLPFLVSESVDNKVITQSPVEVSPFAPCSDSDRELEFLLNNPTGSPVEIKIVGTQWLGAPVPEFSFGIIFLLAFSMSAIIILHKKNILRFPS